MTVSDKETTRVRYEHLRGRKPGHWQPDWFDHDSLVIMDFEESLNYDIKLVRESPAVPKSIKLYGLLYEISSGKLTEAVRDIPA